MKKHHPVKIKYKGRTIRVWQGDEPFGWHYQAPISTTAPLPAVEEGG
jgi:hypothetical protein